MPLSRTPALVGAVVGGRYRLIQLLGSGGVGDVYVASPAHDTRGERVAIKTLRREHRFAPELVRRFRREAEAAARVCHPNVLTVLEAPFDGGEGILCFAMELLVGLDLADTLAYAGALGSPRAVGIALSVADGLAAAHGAGVVHRDVKPENIFLVHAADGREAVKLIDFGFASIPGDSKRTGGAGVAGTPEYIAPEQVDGAQSAPAADVYSLAVVLFEMLAGRRPFAPGTPRRGIAAPAVESMSHTAVVSPALEATLQRGLAPTPAQRFGSMIDFHRALLATPEAQALGVISSARRSG